MRFFQKSKENSNNNSRNGLKNTKECAILLKSLYISAFLKKGAAKNGDCFIFGRTFCNGRGTTVPFCAVPLSKYHRSSVRYEFPYLSDGFTFFTRKEGKEEF